jgi:peptide/nickel transport system permease protein
VSSYLTFRILKGLFVVVLISVLTFIVMRLMPGDPVYLLLGEGQIPITDAQIAAIRAKWGLDRPLHEQYFVWAGNLLRGDFGESLIRAGVPVRDMIFEAIPSPRCSTCTRWGWRSWSRSPSASPRPCAATRGSTTPPT